MLEGITQGIYYKLSKDFMEAGKRRLAGDTARVAYSVGPWEIVRIVAGFVLTFET